jgi:circadian clock protein KaiC
MRQSDIKPVDESDQVVKAPTGIRGLDEILNGGLPAGRPTLICGGPGCGKTLMAMEFLVKGTQEYDEPGVFMSFEENERELSQNFSSLNMHIRELIQAERLTIEYVYVDRSEIEVTGEYNLEGLFIRLALAIDEIKAKRVVLDTIETLFSSFDNEGILRSELRRLFRWLKDKGVTAVITAERGRGQLTRHGLEEYVSDCVILLDHRVDDQIASRFLRVVKYRGSQHGADEFPFLIRENGIWVMPITSVNLNYPVCDEYVSSGVPRLDAMLDGKGFYRGSSVLVSGTAGSGKTSLAAHFVDAACKRGEKCLYFAFEEPPAQIIRNMRSIGIDLEPWVKNGLLNFQATRPSKFGIEMHLLTMQQMIQEYDPSVVVVDPITNLLSNSNHSDVHSMAVRLIDFLKMYSITAIFNSLTSGDSNEITTDVGISSLMDTWLLVRYLENNGERNRGMYVLKARGINHSNQIREFKMSDHGIELLDVYLGEGTLLTGAARVAHEAQARLDVKQRDQELVQKKRELEQKHREITHQIEALQVSLQSAQEEITQMVQDEETHKTISKENELERARSRRANEA